jgi:hypothetical protein
MSPDLNYDKSQGWTNRREKLLTWEQVTAWRLAQHSLTERRPRAEMLNVVSRVGALQAQVISAAELQLWARVEGITPDDVQRALWEERTLVKTWALRGTLHLLTAEDFPLYIAALSTLKHFRRGSWLKYHGVTLEQIEAIIEATRTTLGSSGMTREALADSIAMQIGAPEVADLLRSGWGALLKPAAFQGYLCFGPSEGQNVTFLQPSQWLGAWEAIDPDFALQDVARRYLNAYGPATTDEFARWVGLEPAAAKRVFRALGDAITPVEVEGWKAWALAATLSQMETLEAPRNVRLLPLFDPYTIAIAPHSQYLLPEVFKGRVYRPQGWISAVVLVGGHITGVWEYERKRDRVVVNVDLFAPVSDEVRSAIEAEAARLSTYFVSDVQVNYTQEEN